MNVDTSGCNTSNEQVYQRYKNRLSEMLKAADKEYLSKPLKQYKFDMKRTWDIIKQELTGTKVNQYNRNSSSQIEILYVIKTLSAIISATSL